MNSGEGAWQSGDAVVDHCKRRRRRRRRRGAALYAAIFEATLEELTAVGYAELTMERVARRAGEQDIPVPALAESRRAGRRCDPPHPAQSR